MPNHDLQTQILATYRNLNPVQARGEVTLADLRDALPGIRRADLDAGLDHLFMERRIDLVPEVNRKILTRRERDAAIRHGGEDRHYLTTETTYR